MSLTAALPMKISRLPAPLLSILGGAIVVAGWFYACLFVMVAETCRPRYCHFNIVHSSILSGSQILAILTHPADPPFDRSIVYPAGFMSLMPLAIGGVMLLIGLVNLLRRPPRWVLWLTLGMVAIGLIVLLYDSALIGSVTPGYLYGYVLTTTITPVTMAGHIALYLGYLLIMLGNMQLLRRHSDSPTLIGK